MHPVWGIYDFVHALCSYLAKNDLAKLARTAKLFRPIAVRHIWRELDDRGISALLQIVVEGDTSMSSRWSRFNEHAGFVRSVAVTLSDKKIRSRLSRIAATRSLQCRPILPHLRTLCISPRAPEDLLCGMHLMSTTLEVFDLQRHPEHEFGHHSWRFAFEATLHQIDVGLPHLQELHLSTPLDGGNDIPDQMLTRPSQLVKFSFSSQDYIKLDAVKPLSRLGGLHKLSLTENEVFLEFANHPSSLNEKTFDSRTSVTLHRCTQDILRTLDLVVGPLRQLSCNVDDDMSSGEILETMHVITRFAETLESVELYFWQVVPNSGTYALRDDISPLMGCRKVNTLHMLCLTKGEPFDFTDGDLLSIAKSFPDLEDFELQWLTTSDSAGSAIPASSNLLDPNALTLRGLEPVLERCPKLSQIHLSSLSAHNTDGTAPRAQVSMRHVCITFELLSGLNPFAAGLYLSRWIPNCSLEVLYPGDEEVTEKLRHQVEGKQVSILMAALELLRCYRQVVDEPLVTADLSTPEVTEAVLTLENLAHQSVARSDLPPAVVTNE